MKEDGITEPPATVPTDVEDMLKLVGTTGRLNIIVFMLASFGGLINAMNIFSYGFLGATPDYWCKVDSLSSTNWTSEMIRNISIPLDETGEYSKCEIYDVQFENFTSSTFESARSTMDEILQSKTSVKSCDEREFSGETRTTVTEWDLVCERRVLYSTTQAAIQLGILIGSVIFGILIDRLGRKFMFSICACGAVTAGFVLYFSPNVETFIAIRVISSVFGMGLYTAGFVLCLELCSAKQRSFVGNVISVPWAMGVMILPLIAYFIRTWYYLQLAISLPALPLLLCICLMPESPRWLITKGRHTEAATVFEYIAIKNKREVPDRTMMMKVIENSQLKNSQPVDSSTSIDNSGGMTFSKLILHYLGRTMCIFFCWFSVSLVYYGVSLGSPTPSVKGNDYLYIFVGGVLEVFSYLSLWPMTAYFGRKNSLIGLFISCSISILSAMTLIILELESEYVILQWILFLFGKYAITAAFQLIWLYTAELYPTNFRSLAVGSSSSVARVGSICSSYINDLLSQKVPWAPSALFGGLSAISGFVVLLLPETRDINLPDAVMTKDMNPRENKAFEIEE